MKQPQSIQPAASAARHLRREDPKPALRIAAGTMRVGLIGEAVLNRNLLAEAIRNAGFAGQLVYSLPGVTAVTTGPRHPVDLILFLRPEDDTLARDIAGPPDPLRLVTMLEGFHAPAGVKPKICLILGPRMDGVAIGGIRRHGGVALSCEGDSWAELLAVLEVLIEEGSATATPAAQQRLRSMRAPGDLELDELDRRIILALGRSTATPELLEQLGRADSTVKLRITNLGARLGLGMGGAARRSRSPAPSPREAVRSVLVRRLAELGWFPRDEVDERLQPITRWEDLAPEEMRLARHIADGKGRDPLAALLGVSRETVERQVAQLCGRLGLLGRGVQAIRDHLAKLRWPPDGEREGGEPDGGGPEGEGGDARPRDGAPIELLAAGPAGASFEPSARRV